MNVQYWAIGSNTETTLGLTLGEISGYLAEDWMPSFPASVSSAFMGWPTYLIEKYKDVFQSQLLDYLTLREGVVETERQWKGFLSWMLGVAGTRHIIKKEGYRWIAPASAFYPNLTYPVNLSNWNPLFPPSIVTATLPTNPKSRLRPDYLAIRMNNRKYEWAVVESKGISRSLTNMRSCPTNWYNQVRNIDVKVNGVSQNIPRNIVVATRSNPNAKLPRTRRLQIRAWNSGDRPEQGLPPIATADVVAADLFGVFKNLGLFENARALSNSVAAREASSWTNNIAKSWREILTSVRQQADSELERLTFSQDEVTSSRVRYLDTQLGRISFEISTATLSLASRLSLSVTQEEALDALVSGESQIEEWTSSQNELGEEEAVLSIGIRVNSSLNR